MKEKIRSFWHKAARTGLREGEGALHFREVILMNRLLVCLPVVMTFYIPVEVYVNGFMFVPAVLLMIGLFMATLLLNYFRLFRLAKYYLYSISSLFIVIMGAVVGKGINNHVMLMPILLAGVILFKTNIERVIVLLCGIGFVFLQRYLFSTFPEQLSVSFPVRELFSLIFFILGMVLTFLIGIYFIGINNEYESIIVTQKESLEIKNKEITDSISYARRIQSAILPPQEVMKAHLPDSFVLYLPKDVVAGDFYWMEKVNDSILFAAADCTGHGVPGALVSLICNNALNRSVREERLTDPGKILDRTRTMIISEFERSKEDVKDGMDISFCTLNMNTKELKWAGANNPLWLISDGELTEFKGDKQPVGKHFDPSSFTTNKVQLKKGDILYVMTDGYQDQFGGPKGKKFKASNLKKLLLEIHSDAMEKQSKIIAERFADWKGLHEQVDDVCLIGVKI